MARVKVGSTLLIVLLWFGFATGGEARKARIVSSVAGKSEIVFVAAKEKGYYQDEGLDTELIVAGGIGRMALIAGEVEFSSSGSASLVPALRGAPLRVIFSSFYRTTLWLYSKPELRDLQSLKGKKIGISRIGDTTDIYLREVLRRQGLEVGRDVILLATGQPVNRYAALTTGVVDASVLADPFNFTAKEAGYREIVSFLKDDSDIVHLSGAIVTREALLKSDPSLVEKFTRASLKGLRFVRGNRAGTAQILARNMKISEELAAKTYDLFRPAMTVDGSVSVEMQQKALDLQAKIADIKESPPLKRFFDFSLTQKIGADLSRSAR